MNKILALATPTITGSAFYAYYSAITLANDQYLPWYYNNHVQLYCDPNLWGSINFNPYFFTQHDFFIGMPIFYSTKLTTGMFNESEYNVDIGKFLQSQINEDFYIFIYFNEFYIPRRKAYKKYKRVHENIIYGFNLESQVFNIFGFDDNGKFSESLVNISDLRNAFVDVPANKYLISFKLAPWCVPEIDIELIYKLLNDYVNSKNSYKSLNIYYPPPADNFLYGLEVYERIYEMLKYNNAHYDVRPFQMLLDHKTCMLDRLKYLSSKKIIINITENIITDYTSIVREHVIVKNLFLKRMINNNYDSKKYEIIDKLKRTCEKEKNLLTNILNMF